MFIIHCREMTEITKGIWYAHLLATQKQTEFHLPSYQQFQGCLQVTLKNSLSGMPVDDNEVRRKFQQFGDVKSIQSVGDRVEWVLSTVFLDIINQISQFSVCRVL